MLNHSISRVQQLCFTHSLWTTTSLSTRDFFHSRTVKLSWKRSLCGFLPGQPDQLLCDGQVSSMVDERHIFKCDDAKAALCPNKRVGGCWAKIFTLKTETCEQKYPLLLVVKAILSLPNGNADVERGFSENNLLLHWRSSSTQPV